VTSAIGLGLGIGTYLAAGVTTLLLLLSLVGLRTPRRWLRRRFGSGKDLVIVRLRDIGAAGPVLQAIGALPDIELRSVEISGDESPPVLEARLKYRAVEDLSSSLASIAAREDVTDIAIG
jgi:uncharacterized membrane protein YhiD involved in acid resistance